jgi:Amidase
VIGKAQVPEFGYSGTGQTPLAEPTANPWCLDRASGGSSAGSGAAVATGIGPVSLGSDGGGSVRIPASFCGLAGVKATMGRVPLYPGTKDERYPGVSSWESLEHIGPLTRTVADAALVLSVVAGPDDRDRLSLPAADFDWRAAAGGEIRGLRVAYSPDLGYAAVDPEVRQIVDQAVQVFEQDLGCTVERADPGWPDPYETFWGLVINDSDLAGLRKLAGSPRGPDEPSPGRRARAGRELLHTEQTADRVERRRDVHVGVGLHPAGDGACLHTCLYDGHCHPFLRLRDGTHPLAARTCEPRPLARPGRSDRQRRWVPKTGDPGRQIVIKTTQAASADSQVRPGPSPRPYAHTTAEPRKQGRSTIHILPADSARPEAAVIASVPVLISASSGRYRLSIQETGRSRLHDVTGCAGWDKLADTEPRRSLARVWSAAW